MTIVFLVAKPPSWLLALSPFALVIESVFFPDRRRNAI